jgi:3-hydroxybutyryl-CoA dehydrogenase
MKVVVLGAGLMGAQIGSEYLLGGHTVTFVARDLVEAAARVERALELAAHLGVHSPEGIEEAANRMQLRTEPELDCDLVVESLPEELSLKVALLQPLAAAPSAPIVVTNTSSLSVTTLGSEIGAPERILGTHYWNPPLLMPLVELVLGEETDAGVARLIHETLLALGKRPVVVRRDVPGFVWNRLQFALVREALWLVEHGVVTPEELDEVVSDGLARRWRQVGPFEAAALGGLDTWLRVGANLLPELSEAKSLAGLERHVPTDTEQLATARDRRDEALARELRGERDAG